MAQSMAQWTPMRWPDSWTDPSILDRVHGTAIDYLLITRAKELDAVRDAARKRGIRVADLEETLPAVTRVKGEWPGVKMGRGAQASAGPTGVAWVDSNGWLVRLEAALHPETSVWVDAPPAGNFRLTAASYLLAIADSAARGGRWIVTLDPQLTAGIAAGRDDALATWKAISGASAFFAGRKAWLSYSPMAVAGVISDFTGDNEFFNRELLNLLDRAGQHYRILLKDRMAESSFSGLRAVLYADAAPPSPALRKQILTFVQSGGTLITSPKWGDAPGAPARGDEHPRYTWRTLGKGRMAVSKDAPDDPYLWANESVVLVSHRYDLVRFWNGGATGSFCAASPDRRQAVAHLLFYANRGPDQASVRIAGRYRTAKAWAADGSAVAKVEVEAEKDAVEVHLPQVPQYVALELE
jgi:hypothetical protein